jgi:hypothetical protein
MEGYVVKIRELNFPGPDRYLESLIEPNESPYHRRTQHLTFAKVFDRKSSAETMEQRVRNWFEETFEDNDSFSIDTQKVEISEV